MDKIAALEEALATLKKDIIVLRNCYMEVEKGGPKKRERDWECEGHVWEDGPCTGCGNCDQQTRVIYGNKKRVVCKSCKLKYDKYKRDKTKKK